MTNISIRFLLVSLMAPLVSCGPGQSQTIAENQPAQAVTQTQQQTQDSEQVSKPKIVDGFEEILWEDMMPEGEEERLFELYMQHQSSIYGIAEGSAADKAYQIGTFNVVDELDGKKIRLPGYTVPLDYSDEITEFLLVPYFGACLHQPPPPPNQTLYITSEEPIKLGDLAQAVWVYGTIRTQTQRSDLADTAYTLELSKIEEYEY